MRKLNLPSFPDPDYEMLFNSAPTPLLVIAPPDWVIVAANNLRIQITGTTREEAVGRKLFDVFPDNPEDPSADGVNKLAASLERVVATRQPDTMPTQLYSLRDENGRFVRRWWSPINSPVLGADGQVKFVIHRVEEVTDAVRMDLLLDSLPGVAYRCEVDAPWRMEYASPGAKYVCSFSPEDFKSGSVKWGDLIDEEDLPQIGQELKAAIEERRHFSLHYRIIDPQIGTRWVSETGQAVYNQSDEAEALVGFISDVTEREQTQAKLRRAEQRYALAARATGEIIWDLNLETLDVTRKVPENSAFYFDDPQAQNSRNWWASRIHPDDAPMVERRVEQLRVEKGSYWSAEYRLKRPDGTYAYIFDQGFLVPTEPDGTPRMVGAMQDISERKAAEAQLEQLQAELIHVSHNSAMGAMAATLAHELNQPLAAASNYLSGSRNLISRDLDPDHPANIGLDEAAQQIHRAGEIIRRMRSLVRNDGVRREEVSLTQLVARTKKLILAGDICPFLKVFTNIPREADIVWVDQIQIEQVLLNLLRNSCEAMTALPEPEISIHASLSSKDFVEVQVIDRGSGMSPSTLASLFTAYGESATGGLGVGLSISRTIVEGHGGHISARNNEDQGVTFSFTIPRSRPNSADS